MCVHTVQCEYMIRYVLLDQSLEILPVLGSGSQFRRKFDNLAEARCCSWEAGLKATIKE